MLYALYALYPVYNESVLGHISAIDFAQESLRLSISIIAYSLLHAAERILSVIPVEVVAGPCYTPRGLNELGRCWALLLTVQTPDSKHTTCLVPVQLNMKGGAAIRHIYTEHKNVLPWDMPISLLHASQSWHLDALSAIPNYTDIYIKAHERQRFTVKTLSCLFRSRSAVSGIHHKVDWKQHLVNNVLSCAFHSLCPGIPNEGSVFCP